ncbi:MAG: hypothetical protein ACRD4Q_01165 [Candidatus Acidiferrales bacterium]
MGTSYFGAVGSLFENPVVSLGSVADDIGSWASPLDPIYNIFGYVGPGQKSNLIAGEAQTVTQAGGDASQAAQQAASDITNALTQAGADPSQATGLNAFGSLLKWIGIGAALLAILWITLEAVHIL